MLVHDIRKNRSWVIDFGEMAPLGIPLDEVLQKDTKVSSGVPCRPLQGCSWLMSPALLYP